MCLCHNCKQHSGIGLLIIGIAYLLVDLGVWTAWGVSFWTTLTIYVALAMFLSTLCADCKIDKKKK